MKMANGLLILHAFLMSIRKILDLVFQEGDLYFILYSQILSTLYPNSQSSEVDKCALLFKEEKNGVSEY